MAPPLDRKDLWKGRSSKSWFRFPRRTRRATYLCWALIIAIFYTILQQSTNTTTWDLPSVSYFEQAPEEFITIRFPNLYHTLVQAPGTRRRNRNVLFAANNLTAASKMAGIACEMAEYRRSHVHIALMGFDTLDVDEFKEMNGLALDGDDSNCQIFFHDARADSGERMSKERRSTAVKSAFKHIGTLMGPQAVLVDPSREDKWFIDVAREKCKQIGMTFIELPEDVSGGLSWITRLDSASIKAWNTPTFEIVIHADTHSGNLERLLRSIEHARYPTKKHRPTRITIILDSSVPLHPFTKHFLQQYSYPSRDAIIIRRPLIASRTPQDRAISVIDSFYSLSPHHSVLFLDPNTELSPWYLHYLLYTTLEYRFSGYNNIPAEHLYGISLELPPTLPTGATPDLTPLNDSTLFLHTAPSSRAALYFPSHWSEIHSYLSHNLLPTHPTPPKRSSPAPRPLELDTSLEFTWRATTISLARARGYLMLYPSLPSTLALIHAETPSSHNRHTPAEAPILKTDFPSLLGETALPSFHALPVMNLWGEVFTDEDVAASKRMVDDAENYRLSISTCSDAQLDEIAAEIEDGVEGALEQFEVRDLFCDGTEADEGAKPRPHMLGGPVVAAEGVEKTDALNLKGSKAEKAAGEGEPKKAPADDEDELDPKAGKKKSSLLHAATQTTLGELPDNTAVDPTLKASLTAPEKSGDSPVDRPVRNGHPALIPPAAAPSKSGDGPIQKPVRNGHPEILPPQEPAATIT